MGATVSVRPFGESSGLLVEEESSVWRSRERRKESKKGNYKNSRVARPSGKKKKERKSESHASPFTLCKMGSPWARTHARDVGRNMSLVSRRADSSSVPLRQKSSCPT